MKNYDLELEDFDCGSSGVTGELREVDTGDYLLRQDVQNMCQEIKRAINYKDYAERIMEIFDYSGL